MKAIEVLRHFKNLSHIDKLRLTIHLLENSNLEINTNNELNMLKNQLTELDKTYATVLVNFNKYKHLTVICAMFMETSEIDRNTLTTDILDNIFKTNRK